MKTLLIAALMLGAAPSAVALAAASPPTLCRVTVTSSPGLLLDKRLEIRQRPGCTGISKIRFRSDLGGTIPDRPPGAYTLYPNQVLVREAPYWWHTEWVSASDIGYVVPETLR